MKLPEWEMTATEPEVCELLAALVRVKRPKVVAEAGTYRGHAALLMADACRTNGMGHVYTFDPHDHGIGKWITDNDLGEWCTYVQGDYLENMPGQIDFAFIDASEVRDDGTTDPSIREIHFNTTRERLGHKGIICAHDTRKDVGADWRDGEGGKSMYRIREQCDLNIDIGRGLSIYSEPT